MLGTQEQQVQQDLLVLLAQPVPPAPQGLQVLLEVPGPQEPQEMMGTTEPQAPRDPQVLKGWPDLRVQQVRQALPEQQEQPALTEMMERQGLRVPQDPQEHKGLLVLKEPQGQRVLPDQRAWCGRAIGPPLLLILWMMRSTIQQTANPTCANRLIPHPAPFCRPIPHIGIY